MSASLICFSYFVVQLYEAHKQMNIEKLDKSLSYKSLESARKVAEEMQKQASDYAKVAGQERGNYVILKLNQFLWLLAEAKSFAP